MNLPPQTVGDVGEQGLLQRLLPFCATNIVGDDGALLAIGIGQSLVVTTDVLVDGVHFSDRTTSAEDVGWRAAAANLSDLAAMGAAPLGITVGLSLPPDVTLDWVEGLYRGLNLCLNKFNTKIIGGDVCRSSVITVAITACGQVAPHRAIRRSAARPGDAIVVTGPHGGSRAGLELLLHPEQNNHLEVALRQSLIENHRRPIPRLDIIAQINEIVKDNWPVGGMDSSDGLADAVMQICRCSGVGAEIDCNAIPLFPGWQKFGCTALDYALYGGEDFELVLCLPEKEAISLVRQLGEGAAVIGKITAGVEVKLVDAKGVYPEQMLNLEAGFQHF